MVSRKTPPRKKRSSVEAIRNAEAKGESLSKPELKKLLRAELSRVVRHRDEFECFLCGKRAEPGIRAWQGQCAHLRPIDKLPPLHRYDPDFCVWMCGVCHSEFDGNQFRGRKAAYQLPVLSKLQRVKPDVYEQLEAMPIARGADSQLACELRDQLAVLRGM